MLVVVGLGNRGGEYAATRHNIGWLAVDALARHLAASRFRREKSVEAAEARVGADKLYLLKPQTYMNRSGQALASWLGWFGEVRQAIGERAATAPADPAAAGAPALSRQDRADDAECRWPGLLVVADDVNLPLGKMRFRPTGSAGGHNGLTDIEKALGGRGYPRLRLGVGAPPERMDRADYVLARFAADERPVVDAVVETAARAILDWARLGMDAVRGKYNGVTLGGAAAT
ncbi:MAG: aminoacyl-tRNA hydrolase [Planctomycetes bacterium]|nr:aminoacyl-tRNA hydrolase [Planctomycetota bacterium]